jgi:tetratricopeptide (TPR) repeat protein
MLPPESTSPTPTQPFNPNRLNRRLSLLGLSFALILLAVIAGAAYAGYRAGVSQREKELRATQTIELQQQYDLGLTDLAAGRSALAAERFEYILKINPDYPGAADQLARARAAQKITPTPTQAPVPTPASQAPADLLRAAQQYVAAKDWDNALSQLTALRSADPAYELAQVNTLLFTAFRERGVARIFGDELESGIFDLTQAEAFGPLDDDAKNYRAWARLYLNAQSFWSLDWPQTILNLQLLYVLAPNFKDTSVKYYQATLQYGDQLARAGDYCAAAEQYALSQTIFIDQTIADTQATALAVCALTPTPTPTLDPALVTPIPPEATPIPTEAMPTP